MSLWIHVIVTKNYGFCLFENSSRTVTGFCNFSIFCNNITLIFVYLFCNYIDLIFIYSPVLIWIHSFQLSNENICPCWYSSSPSESCTILLPLESLVLAVTLLVLSLYQSFMAFEESHLLLVGPSTPIWMSWSSLSSVRLIRRSFLISFSCKNTLFKWPFDNGGENKSSIAPLKHYANFLRLLNWKLPPDYLVIILLRYCFAYSIMSSNVMSMQAFSKGKVNQLHIAYKGAWPKEGGLLHSHLWMARTVTAWVRITTTSWIFKQFTKQVSTASTQFK